MKSYKNVLVALNLFLGITLSASAMDEMLGRYRDLAGGGIRRITNYTCQTIDRKKTDSGATRFARGPVGVTYRFHFKHEGESWTIDVCDGSVDRWGWLDMHNNWEGYLVPEEWFDKTNKRFPIFTTTGNALVNASINGKLEVNTTTFKKFLQEANLTITNEPLKADFVELAQDSECSNAVTEFKESPESSDKEKKAYQTCGLAWINKWIGGRVTVRHFLKGRWVTEAENGLGEKHFDSSIGGWVWLKIFNNKVLVHTMEGVNYATPK